MPSKGNLAVFETALILLQSSLVVNDADNNLFDSLP